MKRLKVALSITALALTISLSQTAAPAQEADTLSISGIFLAEGLEYPGIVGADLAEVLANGNEHGWTLTLYGVSYSHDYEYQEWNDDWSYGFSERYITRVHATSFDFQFVGPDASVLNEVVSAQLIVGNGIFLELWNGDYFDSSFVDDNGPYASLHLGLQPLDPSAGVSFYVTTEIWPQFPADEYGFPVLEPQRVTGRPNHPSLLLRRRPRRR